MNEKQITDFILKEMNDVRSIISDQIRNHLAGMHNNLCTVQNHLMLLEKEFLEVSKRAKKLNKFQVGDWVNVYGVSKFLEPEVYELLVEEVSEDGMVRLNEGKWYHPLAIQKIPKRCLMGNLPKKKKIDKKPVL